MKLTDGSVTYIIHIYRYGNDNSRKVVGTVEKVGAQGKQAFRSIDELWEILGPRHGGEKWRRKSGSAH